MGEFHPVSVSRASNAELFSVVIPEGMTAESFATCVHLWLTRFDPSPPRVFVRYFVSDAEHRIGVGNLELLSESRQRYVKSMMQKHKKEDCGICGLASGGVGSGFPAFDGMCCDHCRVTHVRSIHLANAYRYTMCEARSYHANKY